MAHNFTPEEREARLVILARYWADGMSCSDMGLEIGISGTNIAETIKRARKRGDTRFPERAKNRPPVQPKRWVLTPDQLAAAKDKRKTMADVARRHRVPPGRIKRMYYALRDSGDPRFADPWPLTPKAGPGRAPSVKPVAEPRPPVRDTSGPVTITRCPTGYAAGLSWMGGAPGVPGVHPGSTKDLAAGMGTPQHVHRQSKNNAMQTKYNGRDKRHNARTAAVDAVLR